MMYGPDEDERTDTPLAHPAGSQTWLAVVSVALLLSAFAWGLAAPIVP